MPYLIIRKGYNRVLPFEKLGYVFGHVDLVTHRYVSGQPHTIHPCLGWITDGVPSRDSADFILASLVGASTRGVLAFYRPIMTSLLMHSCKYPLCIIASIWLRSWKHSLMPCLLSLRNLQYLVMFLCSTEALIGPRFQSRIIPSNCMRICSLEVLSGV